MNCQTGTIHQTNPEGTLLKLVSQIGVPAELSDKIASIPFGKGIAGAAAETKAPVKLCNLQHDLGGVALPNARITGVSGSLAVPIFATTSDQVIGTLGVGRFDEHDFDEAEILKLQQASRTIADVFENKDL
ncbi:MAG: GAF domain-containing protein [Gloeobacteraceae cyanobacterium ES-bin-144]|nr:GAF domain-containing protein [Verrucomicrobiales bacterium]